MMSKPTILITNDDGIEADGLLVLAHAMKEVGEVFVVAPRTEQSAVSYMVTIRDPLRFFNWDLGEGITACALTGTPADCVKFGVGTWLGRKPDLVVSGINQGPNTAVNVLHSGTVGGAMEGCVEGIPSVAFSLDSFDKQADYTTAGKVAQRVAHQVLNVGLPDGIMLNVNIPYVPEKDLKGFRIARQARSRWDEAFTERKDPIGRPYYWLAGYHINLDEGPDTDLAAVEAGYVSVTPLQLDRTDHVFARTMKEWTW
ncbi:MAG: 5'/3'-nucleotidase SurE [Bacteroidetes Order II. Incertae sedis bacterium]|nr:5'/3'-nucleotidase SurE [Bacteroidetes Order II. bacterium]